MRQPSPPALLLRVLLAVLLGLLPACGGAKGADPFEEPAPPPPTGGGGGGGGSTPPPPPPAASAFEPNAAVYGRTALFGSFPSDLYAYGETVFTVDADQIEAEGARILAYDVSGATPLPSTRFAPITVRDQDLVDSAGNPGDVSNPVGFGYFLNDLLIVSDRLGFVLVGAGGSDSAPTLSNVVAFDPTTGTLLQTLDLANPYVSPTPLIDSRGGVVPGNTFVQSGAEGLEFVPTGPAQGLLFVAMSNLVFGAPSFGQDKLPGTVQVFAVRLDQAPPLRTIPTPGLVTRTLRTQAYNPVAVQAFASESTPLLPSEWRVLVTVAGTTGFNANFQLVPLTNATVEAYRATDGAYLGQFVIGLAGLSAIRPAVGRDAAGNRVGFFPSSVTGEVYLLQLTGLYRPAIDTSELAVLRGPLNGIPITAAPVGTPGGNVTGVALSPDGRTLAVTGFGDLFAFPAPAPGRVFLLALPANLVTGAGFGVNFTPGSTEYGTVPGRTMGKIVAVPSSAGAELYMNVGGPLDANFLGAGPASLGTLETGGTFR